MDASERVIWVGIRNDNKFKLIPDAALSRKRIHNSKSRRWSEVRRTRRFRLATYSAVRRRLKKWRAIGIVKPAWLRRPISRSSSLCDTQSWPSMSVMVPTHAWCFSKGSSMVNRRVSMSQPNTIFHSDGVASARNFLMDRRSSRARDSFSWMGRPRRWMTNGMMRVPRCKSASKKAEKISSM